MGAPYFIDFKRIGQVNLGFISVAQQGQAVPFAIKRVYWTYYTPQDIIRGGHANIDKEMILIAVSGTIKVNCETAEGVSMEFKLTDPNIGLYLPKLCWHVMQYSHSAVQVVLASNEFSESDYIRNYTEFKNYTANLHGV